MIVSKQHTTFRTQNDIQIHYITQQISCHVHKVEYIEHALRYFDISRINCYIKLEEKETI